MRTAFINTLIDSAKENNKILLLTGDLGFSVIEEFIKKYPDRYFNIGVAESNMISLATGLSLVEYIPFTYSIASFMTLRPYEQIIRDVAQHNANVKIIGIGAGFSYSHAGPSHQAMEDIAIMRSIPNMTIFCPGDPIETIWATKEAIKINGPVYIRLGKAGDPNLFSNNIFRRVGKSVLIKKGKKICIITAGNILKETIDALYILNNQGIEPTLVHMPTIKPFDKISIQKLAKNHQIIVSVEEHHIINGLGSAIADVLATTGVGTKLVKLGIDDMFLSRPGSQAFLRKQVGIDAENIAKTIKALIR